MKLRKKETYNYFDEFEKNIGYSLECAKKVFEVLTSYNKSDMPMMLEKVHEIEHLGDVGKHKMVNFLIKDFLPPIEREDILSLVQKIDDVTDLIEDILINIDIFNVDIIKPEAVEFSKLLMKCCEYEKQLLGHFKNFKKVKDIKELVIQINDLEEEGDRLYINTMKTLYREDNNTLDIIKWTTIYNCFENCIDLCENLADEIENIVLKNI